SNYVRWMNSILTTKLFFIIRTKAMCIAHRLNVIGRFWRFHRRILTREPALKFVLFFRVIRPWNKDVKLTFGSDAMVFFCPENNFVSGFQGVEKVGHLSLDMRWSHPKLTNGHVVCLAARNEVPRAVIRLYIINTKSVEPCRACACVECTLT